MPSNTAPLPSQLAVVAWSDPVLDALGFLPHDPYSELITVSILGPSATLAWRRLAGLLGHHPEGFSLDLLEFAGSLGLGRGIGRHSPVSRTLHRLAAFRLARFVDDDTYAVRRRVPPASRQQVERFSPEQRRLHTALLARHDLERLGRDDTAPWCRTT